MQDAAPAVSSTAAPLFAQPARLALRVLAAAAALLAIFFLAEEVHRHLQEIESWVAGLGPWGPLAFVAIFVLGTSLLVPESVLAIVAGAIFGMSWGGAMAVAGTLLAGALQYTLARRLLRERIRQLLDARPRFAAIESAVRRDEVRLQWLLRLTPLNPALLNYLLGAAGVRFPPFLLACLAQIPHLFLELYLGHAGRHMTAQAAGVVPQSQLHHLAVYGGLALAILAVAVVSRAAQKAVSDALAAAPLRAG